MSSPMKAKGVGELGICGAAAALANAVYDATGARLRDYPTTLDKLIKGGMAWRARRRMAGSRRTSYRSAVAMHG